ACEREIRWMAQYHAARSRPRKSPPRAIKRASRSLLGAGWRWARGCAKTIHSQRNGSARTKRKKPVAAGPVSARRTRMPAKEMAIAPTTRAASGLRALPAAENAEDDRVMPGVIRRLTGPANPGHQPSPRSRRRGHRRRLLYREAGEG